MMSVRNIVINSVVFRRVVRFLKPHKYILVETSSACPLRCVWCWMFNSEKKDVGLMRFEDFCGFIDMNAGYLSRNRIRINPFYRGEALIHPRFFDMMDYMKARGVLPGQLHTNLHVRDFDAVRLTQVGLSPIVVNVGGITQDVHEQTMRGGDLELVMGNLKLLLAADPGMRDVVELKMNVTKDNVGQTEGLKAFFEGLGGDPRRAHAGSLSYSVRAEEDRAAHERFMEMVYSDEIADRTRFVIEGDKVKPKCSGCRFLVPTVRWDGKISVCCHDGFGDVTAGNAFERPLKNILLSKRYLKAELAGRNRRLKICENCT